MSNLKSEDDSDSETTGADSVATFVSASASVSTTSTAADEKDIIEALTPRASRSHDIDFFEIMCDRCICTGSRYCGIDRRKRPTATICDYCVGKSGGSCCIQGKPVSKLRPRCHPPRPPPPPPRPMPARVAKAAAEQAIRNRDRATYELELLIDAAQRDFGNEADDETADDDSSDDDSSDDDDDRRTGKRPRPTYEHLEKLLNDIYSSLRDAKRVSADPAVSKKRKRKTYGHALLAVEGRCRLEAARFRVQLSSEREQAHELERKVSKRES